VNIKDHPVPQKIKTADKNTKKDERVHRSRDTSPKSAAPNREGQKNTHKDYGPKTRHDRALPHPAQKSIYHFLGFVSLLFRYYFHAASITENLFKINDYIIFKQSLKITKKLGRGKNLKGNRIL